MNSSQIEEALNSSNDGIKPLLSTMLNMNVWNEHNEKVIITAINKLLAVSKTRLQGLEFLNLIISNCSARVTAENGHTWIAHCLVKYPGDDLKEIKLTTIGKIVDNSYEEQEFSKKFISEYISKVLDICLSPHNNSFECEAALETLAICMKRYGSWFAPHKIRVENFLTNFLENSSKQVVESAAVAFHYLQQVGGAGIDGINHKKNFSTNFDKLCVTAEKLFDIFFENEIEIDQDDRSEQEAFEFVNLPHYTQKALHITTKRIKNCLTFITKMLLKGFPVEKEIKPGNVLHLVSRGTAIHRCLSTAKDNSLKDYQFSILLNEVQIELIRLLRSLVIWLHGNALPFSFTVTKILIDCLKKCQSCGCFRTDSLYQETVYKTMGCWIRVSRGALHSHFQTQLVKCILKDVTPAKNNVSLNLSGDMLKHKSKKAIQKAVRERIISSGQGNRNEGFTNTERFNREKNCFFALDTLKHLLNGAILKLHPNTMQELYTSLINTLIDIQTSDAAHPYASEDCEAKLYEVFVAFYEQDTLKILPPLQLTIDVLTRGINNVNRTVALTCEHGLSVLEKLCQPVCPSLFISEAATLDNAAAEEPMLVDENKFVEDQFDDTNEIEPASNEEEPSLDGLNRSENEVNTEVESGRETPKNEEHSSTTLEREPSIHIIDVHVIKTSVDNAELNGRADSLNGVVADEHIEKGIEVSVQGQEEIPPPIENNEPPLKKIRTEEVVNDLPNLKQEALSQNSDDIFEEEPAVKEPHLKEVIVEETSNLLKVKKEEPLPNPEDDVFEEGSDFVDVVNEY